MPGLWYMLFVHLNLLNIITLYSFLFSSFSFRQYCLTAQTKNCSAYQIDTLLLLVTLAYHFSLLHQHDAKLFYLLRINFGMCFSLTGPSFLQLPCYLAINKSAVPISFIIAFKTVLIWKMSNFYIFKNTYCTYWCSAVSLYPKMYIYSCFKYQKLDKCQY